MRNRADYGRARTNGLCAALLHPRHLLPVFKLSQIARFRGEIDEHPFPEGRTATIVSVGPRVGAVRRNAHSIGRRDGNTGL
jgi:hypothetical protein